MNKSLLLAIATGAAFVLVSTSPQAASVAAHMRHKTNGLGLTTKNHRLVFNTVADYERVVDEPTEEARRSFLRAVAVMPGFSSYASLQIQRDGEPDSGLIQDAYFASMLNAELVVQIGGYILRVDPALEVVYVLPAADEGQYDDLLAGNTKNKNVRKYSTSEDVLSLMQVASQQPYSKTDPVPPTVSTGCDEPAAGSQEMSVETSWVTTYTFNIFGHWVTWATPKHMVGKVTCHNYGFFRSLVAEGRVTDSNGNHTNDQVGVFLERVRYKISCRRPIAEYSTSSYGLNGQGAYFAYLLTQPLNKYLLRARFGADGHLTAAIEIGEGF